jgi:hypothetical protein
VLTRSSCTRCGAAVSPDDLDLHLVEQQGSLDRTV